jgi:hypothetical protein
MVIKIGWMDSSRLREKENRIEERSDG